MVSWVDYVYSSFAERGSRYHMMNLNIKYYIFKFYYKPLFRHILYIFTLYIFIYFNID